MWKEMWQIVFSSTAALTECVFITLNTRRLHYYTIGLGTLHTHEHTYTVHAIKSSFH